MPIKAKKEDLRTKKTDMALSNAMFTLLERQNFLQLTVNDLCGEALVSRATFYAHFIDKYDLLEYWLTNLIQQYAGQAHTYKELETLVNSLVHKHSSVIRNLLSDANDETLKILCKYLMSILGMSIEKAGDEKISTKQIVLVNFFTGGLIYYFNWQIENKFPSDVQMMNPYLHDISQHLLNWKPD